jgi:hypothetical protein
MAAIMVITPVIAQTIINQPALPTFLTISALTIKIPEPIIEPATTIVASNNPKLGLKEVGLLFEVMLESYFLNKN